jgi:uncharacterized membrane protein YfhO
MTRMTLTKKRTFTVADILRVCTLAVLFAGLTMLLFYFIRSGLLDEVEKGERSYSNAQLLLYPLGLGAVLSAIATVWMAMVSGKTRTAEECPAWFYPVLSAALAFCGMGLAYVFLGMWPVGEKSAMLVDMHHQYAPLLYKLRDMLIHGGSPLYSFELGLGASFLPLFGYYLSSPFNLLLVLFPDDLLTEGILVITLLKNMLSAACFAAAVQYIYRRRSAAIPAAALMYSMMMYLLAYSWNIMWLDCVMILPLVVAGFEHLMRTGKYLPYVLTLAYTVYANYYIGFMVCFFLVLYYFAFLLRQKRDITDNRRSLLRFTVGSLLGGGLAMFLALPVVLALGQTSAAGGGLPDLAANFDMFKLLGRHLYDTSPTIRSGNLPNLYCGVATMVLVPLFAVNRGIPRRRRVTYIGMLAVMALSLTVNQLDLLWHGLHAPNDLPYRFSFIYCFVLLLIAYESLLHVSTLKPHQLGLTVVGLVAYLMLEERFGDNAYGFDTIYISLALIAIYALITMLILHKKMAVRAAHCLLLLVVFAEMTTNAGGAFLTMNAKEVFTNHDYYVDNDTTRAIRQAVSATEKYALGQGETFYRMEFLPRRTCMDTALFGYRGITSFASSNPYNTTLFMGAMGYAVNGVNSYMYKSFMPPCDSLLGIRYVMLESNLTNNAYLRQIDSITVGDESPVTYYIYENELALPVAYRVNSTVKDWQSEFYNPMNTQNSLFTAMTGDTRPMYTAVPIAAAEGYEGNVTFNSDTSFNILATGTTTIAATVKEAGHYFLYTDCRAASSITMRQGGNTWGVTTYEPFFIDAGALEPGDIVETDIESKSGSCAGNIFVLKVNDDVLSDTMAKLKADGLTVTSYTDDSISGKVNASADGVMFTAIPYDKGWTVKVDGKEVAAYGADAAKERNGKEPAEGDGAMLAFDITAGEHTVEMVFRPRGLTAGILISLISLGLLIVMVLFTGRLAPKAAATKAAPLFDCRDLTGDTALVIEAPTEEEAEDTPPDDSSEDVPDEPNI